MTSPAPLGRDPHRPRVLTLDGLRSQSHETMPNDFSTGEFSPYPWTLANPYSVQQ